MAQYYSPGDTTTIITSDGVHMTYYKTTLKAKFSLLEDLLEDFTSIDDAVHINITHAQFSQLLLFTDTLNSPQVVNNSKETCDEEWRALVNTADILGLKENYNNLLVQNLHSYVTEQHKIKVYTGLIKETGILYKNLTLREYLQKLDNHEFLTENEKKLKPQWEEELRLLRGPQGTQGIQGPQGTQGYTGIQGYTGPRGIPGPTGPMRYTGSRGLTGYNWGSGACGFND